jgi:hypothetical protein
MGAGDDIYYTIISLDPQRNWRFRDKDLRLDFTPITPALSLGVAGDAAGRWAMPV